MYNTVNYMSIYSVHAFVIMYNFMHMYIFSIILADFEYFTSEFDIDNEGRYHYCKLPMYNTYTTSQYVMYIYKLYLCTSTIIFSLFIARSIGKLSKNLL